MQKEKIIYLDHSASTPLDKGVLKKMLPFFTNNFGNAHSVHKIGRDAAAALDSARRKVADILEVLPQEVYFTSGGTESCNWAVKGIGLTEKRNKIVISAIEHAAAKVSATQLQKQGVQVEFIPVKKDGIVDLEEYKELVDEKTALVCVMLANNEVGTIQPIKELCDIAKQKGARFFCDAVQAMGELKVLPKKLGVDMLAFSSHKFYGPKGVGVLYIKSGTALNKHIVGGYQERSMRGGTSNIPLAVGLAEALELAEKEREKSIKKIKKLRDYFIKRVENEIPYTILNGCRQHRLYKNANFSFKFVEGEALLLHLDLDGICCSSGSACSSGSLSPSHVLLAMGISQELAHGSIRFSFGKTNTKEEVDFVIEKLKEKTALLRTMSPLSERE